MMGEPSEWSDASTPTPIAAVQLKSLVKLIKEAQSVSKGIAHHLGNLFVRFLFPELDQIDITLMYVRPVGTLELRGD